MEVHHHPHVNSDSHRDKRFKEYFFEFLMIFLAVTLGFIAENMREHFSDKDHVRQLTRQLIQDLKNDTTSLNKNILLEKRLMKNADTLFKLLQQPLKNADTRKIQIYIDSCYRTTYFTASSGAMTAIKNSLQLRPFAHSKIVSYMTNYEDELAGTRALENYQIQNMKEYLESFIRMHFTPLNAKSVLFNDSVTNGELRNLKQNDLAQLGVDITIVETYQGTLEHHYQRIKDSAIAFMKYIRGEYKLQ